MNLENRSRLAFKRRIALLACFIDILIVMMKSSSLLDQDQTLFLRPAADETTMTTQKKLQFRKDLRTLKGLGCAIAYDRQADAIYGAIRLSDLRFKSTNARPAYLCDTFATSTAPYATSIRELLTFLVHQLPVEQQKISISRTPSRLISTK